MFTGIVTDVGRLLRADDRNDGRQLRIGTRYDPETIELGASITVDGVCLTVTDKGRDPDGNWFDVFAALETLAVTRLGHWQPGRRVNLERSLMIGDELNNHNKTNHNNKKTKNNNKKPTNKQTPSTVIEAPSSIVSGS